MKKIFYFIISFLIVDSVFANPYTIERRREQEGSRANAYYILPWFVFVEGIGELYGGVFGVANIFDSGTDIAGISFQNGNFHIKGVAVNDIFLLGDKESWFSMTLSGGGTDIALKELDVYDVGTDSPNDPFPVNGELKLIAYQTQMRFGVDRAKLSYETYYTNDHIRVAPEEAADIPSVQEELRNQADSSGPASPEADTITEAAGYRYRFELDLTDDRFDSRFGLRTITILSQRRPSGNFMHKNETDESFDIFSREVSLFLPVFWSEDSNHTLAMNYYLSTVINKNEDVPVSRREGNSLGGAIQMRGYPNRRFTDLHTLYYAAEYRYSWIGDFGLSGDGFALSNDALEALQFVYFYEEGNVEQFYEKLWDNLKTNYGVGIRAIMSSVVIRFDVGFSEEGTSKTFLILQPF